MINKVELITTLKNQHKELSALLALVQSQAGMKKQDVCPEIVNNLKVFKKKLLEHLKLEDEVFYPDNNNCKDCDTKKQGSDVTLRAEMEKIVKAVKAFLKKYSTAEKICANLADFEKELEAVNSVLSIRIETEEEGIFDFYLLLKPNN